MYNHILTIYIRCIYGVFGWEITKYTVVYGAYTRFWPTLIVHKLHVARQQIIGNTKYEIQRRDSDAFLLRMHAI